MTKRAFLFDGNSFCYRAFYAIQHLSNSRGEPTNAIYGFLTMLQKIIKEEQPEYLAVCFDRHEPTFRHEQYAEYKSHRAPMPDDLVVQIPRIKEVIAAYNIAIFEKAGYEADDILGTLATQLSNAGIQVFIVTGDKDALQLVNERITVYNTYRDKVTRYDPAGVRERFAGLAPAQITDMMALMGDASDNIPGVKGIGEKGAVQLISQFKTLDNLYDHLPDIKSEAKRKLLQMHRDAAYMSRDLATIDTAVPIVFDPDALAAQPPDTTRLTALFKELEFKKLLSEVEVPAGAKEAGREYHTVATEAELERLVQRIAREGACAVDTETTGANPLRAALVGISVSFREREAYYIALTHPDIATQKGIALDAAIRILKPVLEDPGILKYGQNIKYDRHVLRRVGIAMTGIAFDTMIASYLVNPAKLNHNLDDISLAYLHVRKIRFSDVVGTGRQQVTIDKAPLEQVSEYACEDADCVFRLVPLLRHEMASRGVESLFNEIEMPLLDVLTAMEEAGIALDVALLKKLSHAAEEELAELTACIFSEAGEEFNINSPKQLGAILFDKLKLPAVKKTKTGFSTDVEVLETLAEEHAIARHLLDYREYAKLKSTYLDALPELINPDTGRLHTSFNQTVTATGRLSSSEPNVQNIPVKTELGRKIRAAFIPRAADRSILAADYSQIELRLLAHFSEDDCLVEAFRHDRDIHLYTAALLYDLPEKKVTLEMRHVAKVVNFSIIYGKTPYGLARDLAIPIAEAKAFIDAYFVRYSKIRDYLESLKEAARKDGYVTTYLNRRAYVPDIASRNAALRQFAERAAMNAPLQGSAADLIKKAMIQIHAELKRRQLDAVMILQVHDELVFDVADACLKEVAAVVTNLMEHAFTLRVPLKVDVFTGKTWAKK